MVGYSAVADLVVAPVAVDSATGVVVEGSAEGSAGADSGAGLEAAGLAAASKVGWVVACWEAASGVDRMAVRWWAEGDGLGGGIGGGLCRGGLRSGADLNTRSCFTSLCTLSLLLNGWRSERLHGHLGVGVITIRLLLLRLRLGIQDSYGRITVSTVATALSLWNV